MQGGSDLAQQYVKNACILTAKTKAQADDCASHTLSRKLTELRIAAKVEHEMTKAELLTAYLNVAYFENQAYGIQVAAQRYFSTSAKHLTLDPGGDAGRPGREPGGLRPADQPEGGAGAAGHGAAADAQVRLHHPGGR